MKIQKNPCKIGDIVRVKSGLAHTLPTGLPNRAKVRVVRIDAAHGEVEYQGKRFAVPINCIDSGFTMIPV